MLCLGGAFLWAQRLYRLELKQAYVPSASSGTDSIDLVLRIRHTGGSGPADTLASSNFPFFYNFSVLDMGGARVIHERKFSAVTRPAYYDGITYPFTLARVNVTVRRKLGYVPPGDELVSDPAWDTILGLRVPLRACGPDDSSIVVWDTTNLTVLNSLLQNLKPRIRERVSDTLRLCPPLTNLLWATNTSYNRTLTCEGQPENFQFVRQGPGVPVDSFVVWVQRNPPVGLQGSLQLPITQVAGTDTFRFQLTFSAADTYHVWVEGIDRKCGCRIRSLRHGIRVLPRPPVLPISGPDTVYAGGSYTYSLPSLPNPYTYSGFFWCLRVTGSGPNCTSTIAQAHTFTFPTTPSPSPERVDTVGVVYTVSGNPCSQLSYKLVVVRSCPPSPRGQAVARPRGVCRGQRAALSLEGAAPYDSLHWEVWKSSTWVPVASGLGATSSLYLTPPLPSDSIYRARLYLGPCTLYSAPDTVRVSTNVIDRGFTGLSPNPACAGDTVFLDAYGPGVWYTPDGQGTFLDTLDPQGEYIPASADAGQTIQLCWVIRSQDLGFCRAPGTDTLCLQLAVNASTAQGSFTVPPGADTLCAGGLTAPLGAQILSGTGGQWLTDNGRGTFRPSNNDPNARYNADPADAGKWIHLTWRVFGTCGSADYTDSVYVQSGQAVSIEGPTQLCENAPLVLRALPATGFDSLLWFRGDAASVVAGGLPSRNHPAYVGEGPFYDPGRLPPGDTAFTLYGATGSCESFATLRVTILPAPTALFDAAPRITTMNNPTITFTNQSQGATSYVWNFGDLNQPDVDSTPNPTFSYSAPGTYTVVLLARNDQGCADFYVCTNCIQVLPRKVFLPSAFSPNGDGKNDVFRPLPIEERFYFTRLEVYDRWGQVVFAADNLPAWDGRASDGRPLDPGTYSYRAIILVPNEGLITHTGIVHLVR